MVSFCSHMTDGASSLQRRAFGKRREGGRAEAEGAWFCRKRAEAEGAWFCRKNTAAQVTTN